MARPSKISKDHIDLLDEYIETCWDEYEEFIKSETSRSSQKGDSSFESKSTTKEFILKVKLPTYAWYLDYLRTNKRKDLIVDKTTLDDWKNKGSKEFDESKTNEHKTTEELRKEHELLTLFSHSLKDLLLLQEKMLLNWAISNRYSWIIAKMMLTVNHWYKDEVVNKNYNFDMWSVLSEAEDRFKD